MELQANSSWIVIIRLPKGYKIQVPYNIKYHNGKCETPSPRILLCNTKEVSYTKEKHLFK